MTTDGRPGDQAPADDADDAGDAAREDDESFEPEIDPPWPWSFILLVVAGALYLIFRFVELAIKIFS